MGASNTYSSNPTWLFDSATSHHITNDLNALSLHAPYDGNKELVIGDGTSFSITHVDSLLIQFSNISFTPTNILCVPSISKTLSSVFDFVLTITYESIFFHVFLSRTSILNNIFSIEWLVVGFMSFVPYHHLLSSTCNQMSLLFCTIALDIRIFKFYTI
ncbi:hypothetical protein HanIR_Chr05g0219171 [Helianthus annuus]|nr:hypothetical protein HanIR_Chr05g0219171 [Helianthus annuus]